MATLNKKKVPSSKYVPPKSTKDMKDFTCQLCGRTLREDNFFKSSGSRIWKASNSRALICKDCVNILFDEHARMYDYRTACQLICHYLDWPFSENMYKSVIAKNSSFEVGLYARMINCALYGSKSYNSTIIERDAELLKLSAPSDDGNQKEATWSAQENRNKAEVIDVLGYDPFDGYSREDRRIMFGELCKYFDEDIADDAYKLSVIIQLVINNYQIRQYDHEILKTDAAKFPERIKDLQELKSKLTSSNNAIAKENEISVKNRSNKDVGKSTLTYLMRDLRQKDFKRAEQDYYDQLRGEGTQWAADISMKAIIQNAMFDENDKQEMFNMQRQKIEELQKALDDEMEEKRKVIVERDDLERQIAEAKVKRR